jgi:hypothetical protein
VKSAFIKSLLILCVPFLLGISFEQAALRADYQLAWSPERPSALPFWRKQLSAAVRGFFPADYYPAFPTLLGYITGFGVVAVALSYGLVIALSRLLPSTSLFLLSFVSLLLLFGAALHFGRIATIHHVFHS